LDEPGSHPEYGDYYEAYGNAPPALVLHDGATIGQQLESSIAKYDLLCHPFYKAWSAGELTREDLRAYALATSDWYFNFNDRRCPHAGWLESLTLLEPSSGERNEIRHLSLSVRLLGSYHDGYIDLYYPRVYGYTLKFDDGDGGHRDWRYDELRVSQHGHLVHEIEWCKLDETGRWLIESSDVEFRWINFKSN